MTTVTRMKKKDGCPKSTRGVRQSLLRTVAGLLLIFVDCSLGGADISKTLQLFTASHQAMGTEFVLQLYSYSDTTASQLSNEVFDEIDRLDNLLSNYKESSELSRINREAGTRTVTTDPETFRFMQQSQFWSRASDGAFDITVGKLMRGWGFMHASGHVPTTQELQDLRTVTGWKKVKLDPTQRTVHFLSPGIELDPGGIGKGFAIDAAVQILRTAQVHAAMLSAGGSTIYALGAPPEEPGWKVNIRGPIPDTTKLATIVLRDTSLSSADCSRKHFVKDGHLYCHIMDPRTMQPVADHIQVSVVHPSATASDALSNVLFVLSPAEGRAVLQRYAPQSRALVLFLDSEGNTRCMNLRWPAAGVQQAEIPLCRKGAKDGSS